ncbi:MAG: hypothetical protein CMF52_03345 [Legionellales bacterium]|nr:hypothetical protein [Legionellales bacterium]
MPARIPSGGGGGRRASPPPAAATKTGTEIKCTTSSYQTAPGPMFIFNEHAPRSKISSATPTLANWLTSMGVSMKPKPAANIAGVTGADPSWRKLLECWDKTRPGFEEWQTRLEDSARYGTYGNTRIFLTYDTIPRQVQTLVDGTVGRLIENIVAHDNPEGSTLPAGFSQVDTLEDFRNGRVNSILELAASISTVGNTAEWVNDILDDLMLPYFKVVDGYSISSKSGKIPNQGYFVWYDIASLRGVGVSEAISAQSDILAMDMSDVDIY